MTRVHLNLWFEPSLVLLMGWIILEVFPGSLSLLAIARVQLQSSFPSMSLAFSFVKNVFSLVQRRFGCSIFQLLKSFIHRGDGRIKDGKMEIYFEMFFRRLQRIIIHFLFKLFAFFLIRVGRDSVSNEGRIFSSANSLASTTILSKPSQLCNCCRYYFVLSS